MKLDSKEGVMTNKSIDKYFDITAFCTAFPFSWDSSFVFNGEIHDFWEIVFVLDGQVEVTEDDKIYLLQKNELILHAPMEFHRIKSAANTSPKGFILSVYTEGELPPTLRDGCFALSADEVAEYTALTERILKFHQGTSDSRFAGQEVAHTLSAFLIRLGSNNRPKSRIDNSQSAIEYKHEISVMNEHICQNRTLSEIAANCNISVSYLKQLFQKHAGISPKRFYDSLRIQYAISKIRAGFTSAEIAAEMNFSSACYFSTFFQRQTGTAASAYRQLAPKLRAAK